ncbi:MAG: AMP-binding protein [Acidimicrobiales bacterium]
MTDPHRPDAAQQVTIADVLRGHSRNTPDALGAICGSHRYSYRDLDQRVNCLASALGASGVHRGDRILWLGQNCHRLIECLLATAKLGGVFCPVNWRLSAAEIAFVLRDADPAAVLWQSAEIGDTVREARELAGSDALWILHDESGAGSYEDLIGGGEAPDPHLDASEDQAVLMMYTAAFNGEPNAAMLSHRSLVTQGALVAGLQHIGRDYVYLNCGPLFHVATFMTTIATFVSGGTNVFTPRVDAEELCRLIDAEHCTGAFVMGPTMDQIISCNSDGRYSLKSLRTFAGKPEWTAMVTVDDSPWGRHPGGYGQTEVMGLATFKALGPSLGSHGRPAPFLQIAILGPGGEELAPGLTGEIALRGATVMNGYHNHPELSVERRQGGWHHTRDLGRMESDGSLTFVGPLTRIIKSAAENIYPSEVEACIRTHPAVADVAVIGVPDRTWGQNVKAIVVPLEGAAVEPQEIIDHCQKHIASYKKPKSVVMTSSLPRTGFAVDYDALDSLFGGGGYPGARS